MIIIVAGGLHVEENIDHGLRDTALPDEALLTELVGQKAVDLLADLGAQLQDANFNGDSAAARPYDAVVLIKAASATESGFAAQGSVHGRVLAQDLRASFSEVTGLRDLSDPDALSESYIIPAITPPTPFAEVVLGALDNGPAFGPDLLYLEMHPDELAQALADGVRAFISTPGLVEGLPADFFEDHPVAVGDPAPEVPAEPPLDSTAQSGSEISDSGESQPLQQPQDLFRSQLQAIQAQAEAMLPQLEYLIASIRKALNP